MALSIFRNADALLLTSPSEEEIEAQLAPVGFIDWQNAYRIIQRIAQASRTRQPFAKSLPHLFTTLSDTAEPDQILVNFERFIQNSTEQLDFFHDFVSNPRAIEILFTVFEGSQFLTEILLRHPHYFERLTAHHQLAQPKSAEQFHDESQSVLNRLIEQNEQRDTPALDSLRRFQRWELLRIGTADLLGSFDLSTVTLQLSWLADSLVQASLTLAARQLNINIDDFFVIAMGKLGGEELNYSSDIDLLFLTRSGPAKYRALGQRLIENLTRMTGEGFLYRVDMRLRPWGSSGELVSSVKGYADYLEKHARLWEKQALLKARTIAGNIELGQALIEDIQPHLFTIPEEEIRKEISGLKSRIETQLKQRGRKWGEVKLGQGSIRDIEFVTQYNQLAHGGAMPQIRSSNTLDALLKLYKARLINTNEYRVLKDGYTFLRTVEHHLQLMHYQQTHTLPEDKRDLHSLAKRLGFQGKNAGSRFVTQYQQHTTVIRLIYQHQFSDGESEPTNGVAEPRQSPTQLLPHLSQMHASYLTTFKEAEIKHHADLIHQLSNERPICVETRPLKDGYWQVTIVGFDYLGELSLICGLLFVYGFNIIDGNVFTYEPFDTPSTSHPTGRKPRRRRASLPRSGSGALPQQKIVDVFTLSAPDDFSRESWKTYERELIDLVRTLQGGQQRDAQGELAKRVAGMLKTTEITLTKLYPVDIEIDNTASRNYTVLNIDAPDTIGFLYEFTNALALTGINVSRMSVGSVGSRVRDVLYVTDAQDNKITQPETQLELRVKTLLIKQFTHLLPHSPNPESALLHFREYVARLFKRPNWTEELASLEQPEMLATMARLLGISDFLWQDFLRMQHANLWPILQNLEALAQRKTKSDLRAEISILLSQTKSGPEQVHTLNAFKDREMFRIDMREIQGHINEFGQFGDELTDLVEVVVEAAHRLVASEIRRVYGLPRLQNRHICPLTICALGKCGGRELGFASDIELMFIYEDNGRTTGPRVITNAEYFDRLVSEINNVIATRRDGIFEIDLQLRPYGKAGSLGVSLEAFTRYFAPDGDAWPYERQALVKLRPIAGDVKLGQKIVSLRDKYVYDMQTFDVAAMRAMRERQIRHNVAPGKINAKLSPGGLVDIEYLVQGLQVTYGYRYPNLRQTNTAEALRALAAVGILSNKDYVLLVDALNFFWGLINALRMVRGNSKDLTVPDLHEDEFGFLARRLGYKEDFLDQLQYDLVNHTTRVQEINTRILDSL